MWYTLSIPIATKSIWFLFATAGDFFPGEVNTKTTIQAIRDVLFELTFQFVTPALGHNVTSFANKEPFRHIGKVFDRSCRIFIVTKTNRYVVFNDDSTKRWGAKIIGAYAGVGSGGMIAVGLLKGGLKIHEIWQPLHDLDPNSSIEHTTIPLSILKTWRS
jgi:hypothetical protein